MNYQKKINNKEQISEDEVRYIKNIAPGIDIEDFVNFLRKESSDYLKFNSAIKWFNRASEAGVICSFADFPGLRERFQVYRKEDYENLYKKYNSYNL